MLSAIGIGAGRFRAGQGQPGQLAYNVPEDFAEAVSRLSRAPGDYRILSVHYGQELQVAPDAADVRKLRDEAVRGAGIDVVVGHHAHVAAGVQEIDGRLVFYGLGNFLHLGTMDMSRFGICRDYGLTARLHLTRRADGHLAARAIEVVPLTGMHMRPTRLAPAAATLRVHVLNHLAAGLDAPAAKARGVRFVPRADGSGLHCLPGAEREAGRIGELCAGWAEPTQPASNLVQQIAGACGRTDAVAARPSTSKAGARRGGAPAGGPFSLLSGLLLP